MISLKTFLQALASFSLLPVGFASKAAEPLGRSNNLNHYLSQMSITLDSGNNVLFFNIIFLIENIMNFVLNNRRDFFRWMLTIRTTQDNLTTILDNSFNISPVCSLRILIWALMIVLNSSRERDFWDLTALLNHFRL